MTDDPARLRHTGSARQRALLEALHQTGVAEHLREETWQRLTVRLAAGSAIATAAAQAAADTATASAAGTTATGSLPLGATAGTSATQAAGMSWVMKGVMVAAATGVALTPAISALRSERANNVRATASQSAALVPRPPRSAPIVASAVEAPAPSATRALVAESRAYPIRSNDSPRQRLAAESEALRVARGQLRGGDTTAAMRTLDELTRKQPHGALQQERLLLHIEALAASGHGEAASRAAADFLRVFPESPHRTRATRFIQK